MYEHRYCLDLSDPGFSVGFQGTCKMSRLYVMTKKPSPRIGADCWDRRSYLRRGTQRAIFSGALGNLRMREESAPYVLHFDSFGKEALHMCQGLWRHPWHSSTSLLRPTSKRHDAPPSMEHVCHRNGAAASPKAARTARRAPEAAAC